MKPIQLITVLVPLIFGGNCIYLTNETRTLTSSSNPAIWTEEGTWGPLLEQWALSKSHREKRVMQLPPANEAFVQDETLNESSKESKISPGKIVVSNNNNNNYNNYNVPVKKPPGRQVSETDLYLLGAIEKLVYRVDFMEKRLRRVEEMLYYVMAGNRVDTEPCPDNFTRAGSTCYFFSSTAGREFDWKMASKQCKRLGTTLAELETIEENQDIVTLIQNSPHLRGKDFWTGGLNPGLLWIWSNSARPVANNSTGNNDGTNKNPPPILGDGRCLRLAYNPALRSYAYKGTDCGARYSFICEAQENSASNEITRIGRARKILDEL